MEKTIRGTYLYGVEQRDLDYTDRITYVALSNYILQAAGDDADRNGFGVKDLNAGNCSWVLSRMAVEFGPRPAQGDKLAVRTWVNDIGRMMTTRNMRVTNQDGEWIASAVTQWAVIDLDRRVALDIRSNVDYDASVCSDECPMDKPGRIGSVAPTTTAEHRVVYSDMDFNRHVNAMKYIEWMFDMLPLEYITERGLRRFDVNFHHEARYGDLVEVCFEDGPDSLFEVRDGDTCLCKVCMNWNA